LKVTIEDHHGRGKVIIEYARLEDFDTLMGRFAAE
jgi:ParB family chromosome partitioning protein